MGKTKIRVKQAGAKYIVVESGNESISKYKSGQEITDIEELRKRGIDVEYCTILCEDCLRTNCKGYDQPKLGV